MKKTFAFLFPINGQIQWSSETETTLVERRFTPNDLDLVKDFVETGTVGSFIRTSTNEFIFRTQ